MVWFWIIITLTFASFAGEYFLSYCQSKWHGLVLPIAFFAAASVFLMFNLLDAFPAMEKYGAFLTVHGAAGFIAVILKIGLLYTPTFIHLAVYFTGRHLYKKKHHPIKHNKEYKKMLADDL